MDSDIHKLYHRLHSRYPLELKSSLELGIKTDIDYPILCGTSVSGSFELFYGDLSFEFYSKRHNGEFLAHFHLQSATDAEKAVVEFMNDFS